MRFTMAQPEVSCHPETLVPGARTVISAALCYWADGGEVPPGHGRLPRYTWYDAYAELREKLDALGGAIAGLAGKAAEASEAASQATPRAGAYRVPRDADPHGDREGAAPSGTG